MLEVMGCVELCYRERCREKICVRGRRIRLGETGLQLCWSVTKFMLFHRNCLLSSWLNFAICGVKELCGLLVKDI